MNACVISFRWRMRQASCRKDRVEVRPCMIYSSAFGWPSWTRSCRTDFLDFFRHLPHPLADLMGESRRVKETQFGGRRADCGTGRRSMEVFRSLLAHLTPV